jgi:hypothetical protein
MWRKTFTKRIQYATCIGQFRRAFQLGRASARARGDDGGSYASDLKTALELLDAFAMVLAMVLAESGQQRTFQPRRTKWSPATLGERWWVTRWKASP